VTVLYVPYSLDSGGVSIMLICEAPRRLTSRGGPINFWVNFGGLVNNGVPINFWVNFGGLVNNGVPSTLGVSLTMEFPAAGKGVGETTYTTIETSAGAPR